MKSSILLVCSTFLCSQAANILVLLPYPLYSHTFTFMPVVKELARRGHNVTTVLPFQLTPPVPNITEHTITVSFHEPIAELVEALSKANKWEFMSIFLNCGLTMTEKLWSDPVIQSLTYDRSWKFDLIIAEPYFLQEPLIAFGHLFQAPVISLFPLTPTVWASYLSASPYINSYMPAYKLNSTDRMTLFERFENTLFNLFEFSSYYLYYAPKQEANMRNHFSNDLGFNLPPMDVMLKNVSLHLIDYHFSIGYHRPFHNNVIQIGGLSINNNLKITPEIQKHLDTAEHGVIYMSFGSHFNLSTLGQKSINNLMEAFSRLKQKVLVKWDIPEVANKPNNVIIEKWFPQPGILGHPKCLLMIGHGGLHGITEAAYFGVPLLLIPQFSDQEYNSRFATTAGFARRLDKNELTSNNIEGSIREMLSNPSYRKKARIQSQIIRDRPQGALETAIYWTEYVLRHNGAPHLRPASLDLSFVEYHLLDIVLLTALVLVMNLFIAVRVFKYLSKSCLHKDTSLRTEKNKKYK